MAYEQAYLNTDKELYKEPAETEGMSYYSDSVFLTKEGLIGMDVGGTVIVLPIRKWHQYAKAYVWKPFKPIKQED